MYAKGKDFDELGAKSVRKVEIAAIFARKVAIGAIFVGVRG